jgi:hypothetical protein
MINSPADLLARLIVLFPEFGRYWESPGNYFRNDDGGPAFCGVFAEFSHFFREWFESLPDDRVRDFAKLLSECMSAPTALDEAAATCFLENVSGEPCSQPLGKHLFGRAREFF